MTLPSVSIIIPAYNAAPFILRAAESVLAQAYPHLQLVVVDDGSTDETPDLLKHLGPPIVCLREDNRGPAAARNLGLTAAGGEYVAFLDADDWLLPGSVLGRARELNSRPELGWVYGDIQYVDGTGAPLELASQRFAYSQRARLDGDLFPVLIRGNFIPIHAPLFRRHLLDEAGQFDEDPQLIGIEDWDLLIRLSRVARTAYLPEICAACMLRPDSLSADPDQMVRRRYALLDKFQKKQREQILGLGVAGRRVLADTHNWFGFAASEVGDWTTATRRLFASLCVWPFQRRAWRLFLRSALAGIGRPRASRKAA